MKKLNKKGFTLVELLAVVVILGILMLVAIPAVQKAIRSSKKGAFSDSAKEVVNAVKNAYANDELGSNCPSGTQGDYYVTLEQANSLMESGFKSPFKAGDETGFITIGVNDKGKAQYSVCIRDDSGAGTSTTGGSDGSGFVNYNSLTKNKIADKNAPACTQPSTQPCNPAN